MNCSFVILHYLALDITCKCVDTLLANFGSGNVSIVIVDNASGNGSAEALKKKYRLFDKVTVITLDSNKGFARGNNAGYEYAVKHYNPDFVIVANNDVLIEDPEFLRKVESEYASEPFSVLGPDIHCPYTDAHQNPTRLQPLSLDEAEALRHKLADRNSHFAYRWLTWKLKLKLGLARKPESPVNDYREPLSDCVLHGACYVFSRDFINAREYAFNPATFLYMEEDILAMECVAAGLKMRYSPSLSVLHLEDASTRQAYHSDYARTRMKCRMMLASLDVLIEVLQR